MRPLALILLAALTAAPGAAFAQQQVSQGQLWGRLDISGVAPAACVLSPPKTMSSANASIARMGSGAQVTITQAVNESTLQSLPASIQLDFPLICNGPNRLIVTTKRGGLSLDGGGPPAEGLSNHIDYTIQANWAGRSNSGSSNSKQGVEIDADGGAGVVTLNIQIPGGGGSRLVYGAYSDTLTLDIQPAT
jgi:hypothetical protein